MASEKSDGAEPAAAKSNQLYGFFGHESSSVLYSMYEIRVPNPLPPPPTKSAQIAEMQNPSPLPNTTLNPILKLKRGEYPRGMCCVQLGSKFYFFGGEYDDLDHPDVAKDVKIKYKNVKRDRYPRDVYVFDPTNTNTNTNANTNTNTNTDTDTNTTIDDNKKKLMMISGTPMQTGKVKPLGFVVDEKIYVVGSTFISKSLKNVDEKKSEIKEHVLFEVYDPEVDKWSTLPTPSHPLIRDSEPEETEWVGHAVVGRKVLLHTQFGYGGLQHRLYCYDLERGKWINYQNLPSYSGSFLGRSEFVRDTLYGVYKRKVSAIAPLADADEEEENMDADVENPLYFPSEDLRSVVDDIYDKFPPQSDSSITTSSLLHLGNGVFCFVMFGRNLHFKRYYAIEDNKKGVISIVIFQALGDKHLRGEGEDEDEDEYSSDEDEDERNAGFFRAKFLYSAHYHIHIRPRNFGDIRGCFSLGPSFNFGDGSDPNCAEHGEGPMSNSPSDPHLVPQSVPDEQPWMKEAMACFLQYVEDDINDNFIMTTMHSSLGERRHINHQLPWQLPHHMLTQERLAVQTKIAWYVARKALIEEQRRLQDLQREHEILRKENTMLTNQRDHYQSWISRIFDNQRFQAIADPFEPQPVTSSVPSSSQPTEPLVSNQSGDTSHKMETPSLS
ncbi:hypothetical protein SO802_017205 [Lithocarpus litseifolius]|uniref:Uncharacterized protein n=1 Tax=Lithocarpus litseifolius TaxID=425828 RepID=A0AAW2D023_9ROSI